MKSYLLTLHFTDLDDFMDTTDQAEMQIIIRSDSMNHARLLGNRMRKLMNAEDYSLDQIGVNNER